uniref:J domain-containing protein n=1 Tax=viral metagenome TaxID=1070528 RepID=A0A6C0I5R4_9ZZZZ
MASTTVHNLNIHMYTLDEIFSLFDLQVGKPVTVDDLKRAKKKVLMLHPDKSRLPADYFLFYKKGLDVIVQFYENQVKQDRAVPTEQIDYVPMQTNESNRSTTKKVASVIGEMKVEQFQKQFNDLFEKNMLERPDPSRNEWFKQETALYNFDSEVVTAKNMGAYMEKVKETQGKSAIVQHRGVETLGPRFGTGLYDQDDNYVTCDPFSKLKFDDLRKVHKDQTVFAVSERDFQPKPQRSADQVVRERGQQTVAPLEKREAEQMLKEQDAAFREQMMRKEYAASVKTAAYTEKNKTVLSSFLRLCN